jgi:hypothetical protein
MASYITIIIFIFLNDIKTGLNTVILGSNKMELKLQTKKFGEILYKIDEEDLHLIENHKIYASKPSKNKIYLLRDDKKWLHKLIMPNCPKGYVVDHINRDTLDNRKCNLRYVTHSINGFNKDNLKFSNNEILEILLSDSGQRKIAKEYNISQSLISQIKTGKIYKHLFPDILRVSKPIISKNDKLYTKYC